MIENLRAPPESPFPLWGGGNPDLSCSGIPSSLSLPHQGGGNDERSGSAPGATEGAP
jgi:hypothetical protein